MSDTGSVVLTWCGVGDEKVHKQGDRSVTEHVAPVAFFEFIDRRMENENMHSLANPKNFEPDYKYVVRNYRCLIRFFLEKKLM